MKQSYFTFYIPYLISLFFSASQIKLFSQIETPWSYGGPIGIHNQQQYVNIDGDAFPDRLIYEKINGKLEYLAWERNTANRVGMIRSIQLPNWPVLSCGIIDIDQDGDGDLLLTNKTTGLLYISEQLCPLEFSEPIRMENITAMYGEFKNHDTNGDGIEDLVGSSFSEPFRYYMQRGLGNGEFDDLKKVFIGYTEIFARRFQDLDSDGYTDITITSGSGSGVVYYPGQPEGGWGSEKTVISGIDAPWASAIGDIDGDGHKDVIVANFNGTNQPVYLAHNKGDNTFEKEILFPSLLATTLLECADLNHDGKSEILLAGVNGAHAWLYRNNGNLNFTKTKIIDMYRASGNFSDINNDTYLDIVLRDLDFYPQKLYWWSGNENGSQFEEEGTCAPKSAAFPQAIIANFTQDKIPDELIIVYSFGSNDIYIAEGYGDGRFKKEKFIKSYSTYITLQVTDHNHDGLSDLIINEGGLLKYYRNIGSGNFQTPVVLADKVSDFKIIDTKQDGYPDYLYNKLNSDTLFLLSFEKNGPSTTSIFGLQSSLTGLFVDDFNRDGFKDIAIYSAVADVLNIYINRYHSFEKISSINLPNLDIRDVQSMDFDWDGINDLLLIQGLSLYWMKGDSSGTYAGPQLIPISGKIYQFELLNVADDAREEIIIMYSENANGYYTVKSPATISTRKSLYTYYDRIGLFADLNLDNKPDGAALEYDSTIVWFVSQKSNDYPYVLTTAPCSAGELVKATVVARCEADITIRWDDGNIGINHPGLTAGDHHYYVVKGQDTIETVLIHVEIDPFRIGHLDITHDDGSQNGSIQITLEGGYPPYAISWKSAGSTNGNNTTHLSSGNYLINIMDSRGCNLDTLIEIPLMTGLANNGKPDDILIFPTVAHDKIYIQNGADAIQLFAIINTDGRIMKLNDNLAPGQNWPLDISQIPSGIYLLQIKKGEFFFVKKFMRL
ncbi:MAG: FG-GAP-like repeat-containing protein [Saprospiraceae bacterium]